MAKPDPKTAKKEQRRKTRNWVITIFFATIAISAAISLVSDFVMGKSSMGVAFLILLLIVFIGILFDIVGMAVATAEDDDTASSSLSDTWFLNDCRVRSEEHTVWNSSHTS